ncbi:MAG: DUF86 domain-containing protein [Bacteroidales bacterium]|nr:DUF86 domain-containing protein [Bacteroidales bacterium]
MSERDIMLLLQDILESAEKIRRYIDGYDYKDFLDDDKTIDAVVRNFEVIGEAGNRIDPEFRNNNPEINWNRIRGFRNRLVHDYFGIDYAIVWSIIQNDLDDLISSIKRLIQNHT